MKKSFKNWESNMTKILVINKGAEEGLKHLLKSLLESGKVKGVFTLRKIDERGSVAYSMITDPGMLDDAVPLYPIMPNNAGQLLSKLTMKGEVKEPVAVVVRPCEMRAFTELEKLQKGFANNILFISMTCGGVLSNKLMAEGKPVDQSGYWKGVKAGEMVPDLRPACRACEHFLPVRADMSVALIERDDMDEKCSVFLLTEKAVEFGKDIDGEVSEEDYGVPSSYLEKRKEERKKLFAEHGIKGTGLDGLIETFGRCIGCKGCRAVCPICFCQSCTFDLQDSDYRPLKWESDLKAKGGLRVPPNTIYYHLGRLSHMALSCVGCGSCEDVCPVGIPLAIIYNKVGDSLQAMFNYLPGRDVDEEIPLKTFESKEFSEVEH
jgi:formate dehydrogenase subunit beta